MEVLVVTAIIGFLAAIGIFGYVRAHDRATLATQTETLVSTLRGAQSNAEAALDGRSWGVRCTGTTWTRFSNQGGTEAVDVQDHFRGTVACHGTSEVVFAKLTGRPSNPVTFTITDGRETQRIEVSSNGMMTLQ